jgi:hypothetical protein
MSAKQSVEWELAGETEVLGENLPLCPLQIPLDQTRARTRAAAVGSQRLTAWAMARPFWFVTFVPKYLNTAIVLKYVSTVFIQYYDFLQYSSGKAWIYSYIFLRLNNWRWKYSFDSYDCFSVEKNTVLPVDILGLPQLYRPSFSNSNDIIFITSVEFSRLLCKFTVSKIWHK